MIFQNNNAVSTEVQSQKPVSSTPGNLKKVKRSKTVTPGEAIELKYRRVDREASDAMKTAADKIMEAATLIVNCMTELRPELKALSNRNYKEIQMSTNAVKQLVNIKFFLQSDVKLSAKILLEFN